MKIVNVPMSRTPLTPARVREIRKAMDLYDEGILTPFELQGQIWNLSGADDFIKALPGVETFTFGQPLPWCDHCEGYHQTKIGYPHVKLCPQKDSR